MRILIVEDEEAIAEAVAHILEKNKYIVDISLDGESGYDNALSGIYDIMILDIMLPGMNGLDILREIRKKRINSPVLLLTAKDGLSDKVKGLDLGADDYLTKPFAMEELLARIRSLSRRTDHAVDNLLRYSDIALNILTYELSCGETSLSLGLKEYSIMEYFLSNPGKVISKEKMIEKIWGYDSDAEYNNVEVYISFLRKKLRHINSSAAIKTVRGVGYRLEEQ